MDNPKLSDVKDNPSYITSFRNTVKKNLLSILERTDNCVKCGHKIQMHYEAFCPKCCDANLLKVELPVIGDLFKIMYHMEANGYMSKDEFWEIIKDDVPSNDCYIDIYLQAGEESELERYYKKVAELLGVEYDSQVVMWVSW